MVMKLDRWIVYGNCMVGYIYDDRANPNGTRVITDAIRYIDPVNLTAETLTDKYKLGEPGTFDEHNEDFIGIKPYANIPKIDQRIFLTPEG